MHRARQLERPPTKEPGGERELSLAGLPRLEALVQGAGGAGILEELRQLLQREPLRAPRYRRDLFARVRIDPDEPLEVAIVRDVSRTGVRLRLASSARLDVVQATTVLIEMRLPGTPFVTCEARLVRVGDRHENGVDLAFSFVRNPDQHPMLEALLQRLAARPTTAEANHPR
jgi:PilZ domain-containing protein